MNSFYSLTHHYKKDMWEIIAKNNIYLLSPYLFPCQKGKPLEKVTFAVAAGKKAYDIIARKKEFGQFYSQRIIDVFSQFVDMSDKCYPINIKGVEEQYYAIYNLKEYSEINDGEQDYFLEPTFIGIKDTSVPIFCVTSNPCVFVSEEIKTALLKNNLTNIKLSEYIGCTKKEYRKIKKSGTWPEVHVYKD